jgi:hypothetical protein
MRSRSRSDHFCLLAQRFIAGAPRSRPRVHLRLPGIALSVSEPIADLGRTQCQVREVPKGDQRHRQKAWQWLSPEIRLIADIPKSRRRANKTQTSRPISEGKIALYRRRGNWSTHQIRLDFPGHTDRRG